MTKAVSVSPLFEPLENLLTEMVKAESTEWNENMWFMEGSWILPDDSSSHIEEGEKLCRTILQFCRQIVVGNNSRLGAVRSPRATFQLELAMNGDVVCNEALDHLPTSGVVASEFVAGLQDLVVSVSTEKANLVPRHRNLIDVWRSSDTLSFEGRLIVLYVVDEELICCDPYPSPWGDVHSDLGRNDHDRVGIPVRENRLLEERKGSFCLLELLVETSQLI